VFSLGVLLCVVGGALIAAAQLGFTR